MLSGDFCLDEFVRLSRYVGTERQRLSLETTVSQDLRARPPDVPHQAEQTEQAKEVVADVDFPPEEALVGGTLVVVVVIVPALAQRQDRHQQVVAAVVPRVVTPAAE